MPRSIDPALVVAVLALAFARNVSADEAVHQDKLCEELMGRVVQQADLNFEKSSDKIGTSARSLLDEIVEIDLGITPWPIPGMLEKIDIDGFISNDLKNIFIDNRIYSDIRFENRLRFTYAEEVGHLVLHKEEIVNCEFRTEQDWIKFREEMPEEEVSWFEFQAKEFAGRLLVPKAELIRQIQNNEAKIHEFRKVFDNNHDDLLITTLSRIICSEFGVSELVIDKRIKREKIWAQF